MTTSLFARTLCAAALAAAICAPVHADSFASSASSAGSASSASISDSISGSSNSSSGDDRMAAGQYRVIDIAQAPAKPNHLRMTLRAVAGGAAHDYHLDLPNRALVQRGVAVGELVQVNERVYGYEFAYADTRRPFFLALQDDWQNDLGSRKVTI